MTKKITCERKNKSIQSQKDHRQSPNLQNVNNITQKDA